MPAAVEIRDISKRYKGAWAPALNGLSVSIAANQVFGLLGPNGAGKTTCINIICGLVRQDKGTAVVFGKDPRVQKNTVRAQLGLVPQQIALFGNLTARENFTYIGRLYGFDDAVTADRAGQLMTTLGLARHADKKINAFSGGMKRRANIIASLLHQPSLVIMDEPTAGVDVQSRAMILDFMRSYREQGHTIIYTSHLLDEAQQVCDEVVIIDEGKLITGGSPAGLIDSTPGCNSLQDVFLHFTGRYARD